MKLRLQIFTLAFASFAFVANAQQIPNTGLENWEPLTLGVGEKPVNYDTPDVIAAALGVTDRVVEKESSNIHGGSFSAKLSTKLLTTPLTGPLTVPGIVALGTIVFDPIALTAFVSGGFPMTETPTSLIGYYQYTPAAGDTAKITVAMKASGVIIGGGEFTQANATSGWEMFEVPILAAGAADSIQVIISSSGGFGSATDGSVLYVDDIELTGISAIESTLNLGLIPNVYPNPAIDYININNPVDHTTTMEVYNLSGAKIDEVMLSNDLNKINTSKYVSGVYMFRILDNGKKIYTNKFTISK